MRKISEIIQLFEESVKLSQGIVETNEAIEASSKSNSKTPKK